MTIASAIERYLQTGEHDSQYHAWPETSFYARNVRGGEDLLRALADEVKRRSVGRQHPAVPDLDLTVWTRRKLSPMVEGLFPSAERDAVLKTLEKSVVFLTTDNIERVLVGQSWLYTAWSLANLYLGSVEAELLGPDAPGLLGLSQETTCYVTASYFSEHAATEDFVIHEAAHVFHNCKRIKIGLPETRKREWLLPIEFMKRETFAYSCEAYGWIVENGRGRSERIAMAAKFAEERSMLNDETVEPAEVFESVREACEARNGWKVILKRCSPVKAVRKQVTALTAGASD